MGYEGANGNHIDNLGERRCIVATNESSVDPMYMHFQVADVKTPLLSISKAADMGYECVLGSSGGYLLDTRYGGRVPIVRKGNLYVLELWVKEDTANGGQLATGFAGQD